MTIFSNITYIAFVVTLLFVSLNINSSKANKRVNNNSFDVVHNILVSWLENNDSIVYNSRQILETPKNGIVCVSKYQISRRGLSGPSEDKEFIFLATSQNNQTNYWYSKVYFPESFSSVQLNHYTIKFGINKSFSKGYESNYYILLKGDKLNVVSQETKEFTGEFPLTSVHTRADLISGVVKTSFNAEMFEAQVPKTEKVKCIYKTANHYQDSSKQFLEDQSIWIYKGIQHWSGRADLSFDISTSSDSQVISFDFFIRDSKIVLHDSTIYSDHIELLLSAENFDWKLPINKDQSTRLCTLAVNMLSKSIVEIKSNFKVDGDVEFKRTKIGYNVKISLPKHSLTALSYFQTWSLNNIHFAGLVFDIDEVENFETQTTMCTSNVSDCTCCLSELNWYFGAPLNKIEP